MSETATAHREGGWVPGALLSSILGLSLFESQWQGSERRKEPLARLTAAAAGMIPHLSDDHWDNSKRKSKNAPQGMEREGVSSCMRAVRALHCNKLPSYSFCCLPAPCSHDPKGPAQLKGHCPGARARHSSFYHVTGWHTVVCPYCILQDADIPMMLLKSGTFHHTVRKILPVGARRLRYIFPKELASATAFDVW